MLACMHVWQDPFRNYIHDVHSTYMMHECMVLNIGYTQHTQLTWEVDIGCSIIVLHCMYVVYTLANWQCYILCSGYVFGFVIT